MKLFIWTQIKLENNNNKQITCVPMDLCLISSTCELCRILSWLIIWWITAEHGSFAGTGRKRDEKKKKEETPEARDSEEQEGNDDVSRENVEPQVSDEGEEEGERVWGLDRI